MKWCCANGLRAVAGLALLGSAPGARTQSPPQSVSSAAPVVDIRVVTEDGRVLVDCPSGVTVETGKPLNRADVALSLRSLYRTGDYSDLRAVIVPVASGIRLDFVAKENLFFNRVLIEG